MLNAPKTPEDLSAALECSASVTSWMEPTARVRDRRPASIVPLTSLRTLLSIQETAMAKGAAVIVPLSAVVTAWISLRASSTVSDPDSILPSFPSVTAASFSTTVSAKGIPSCSSLGFPSSSNLTV